MQLHQDAQALSPFAQPDQMLTLDDDAALDLLGLNESPEIRFAADEVEDEDTEGDDEDDLDDDEDDEEEDDEDDEDEDEEPDATKSE